MKEPAYYAIIPSNVRYDKQLTANAKLLYGEITALCNKEGFCWANNKYFATLYGVSNVSISKWINQLINKKYIETFQDEKGVRVLTLVNGGIKKSLSPLKEKFMPPLKEKFKHNNTSINNTINKEGKPLSFSELKDKEKEKSPQPPTSKKGFHNSKYSDIENVRAQLMKNPEHVKKYKGVDLSHYIEAVGIWYDKKGKLTTDRGWMAYIRQFMNDAIKKSELVMKKPSEKRQADLTTAELAHKRRSGNHVNF